jgi:hypothetical protein
VGKQEKTNRAGFEQVRAGSSGRLARMLAVNPMGLILASLCVWRRRIGKPAVGWMTA